MPRIPDATIRRLERSARRAAGRAYAPYSRFPVGAAVLGASGKVYVGCNVENASFGLSTCAERAAVFCAVAAGEKSVKAVAVYTPTPLPATPCGACRQVIHEFGPEALVVCVCDAKSRIETRASSLLPGAFGPGSLG